MEKRDQGSLHVFMFLNYGDYIVAKVQKLFDSGNVNQHHGWYPMLNMLMTPRQSKSRMMLNCSSKKI
jgi:exosome complex RNA-binding protein Rrp4